MYRICTLAWFWLVYVYASRCNAAIPQPQVLVLFRFPDTEYRCSYLKYDALCQCRYVQAMRPPVNFVWRDESHICTCVAGSMLATQIVLPRVGIHCALSYSAC